MQVLRQVDNAASQNGHITRVSVRASRLICRAVSPRFCWFITQPLIRFTGHTSRLIDTWIKRGTWDAWNLGSLLEGKMLSHVETTRICPPASEQAQSYNIQYDITLLRTCTVQCGKFQDTGNGKEFSDFRLILKIKQRTRIRIMGPPNEAPVSK